MNVHTLRYSTLFIHLGKGYGTINSSNKAKNIILK